MTVNGGEGPEFCGVKQLMDRFRETAQEGLMAREKVKKCSSGLIPRLLRDQRGLIYKKQYCQVLGPSISHVARLCEGNGRETCCDVA